MRSTIFGRMKSGIAYVPIYEALYGGIGISTRVGDVFFNNLNGGGDIGFTPSKYYDFAQNGTNPSIIDVYYSSNYTGNFSIKFSKGLKDVYSIKLGAGSDESGNVKYNIQDLETFFNQFPNLYSVKVSLYSYQNTANQAIIKGDLSRFPDSVEKVLLNYIEILNIDTDLVLNLSNYNTTSKLKSFIIKSPLGNYAPKIIGDLGKLPTGCITFDLQKVATGSAITYTSGKVWASSFDTLYFPITLTPFEIDNILIDLKNSVIYAVGSKIIYLTGYRTSASDSSISYLQGLGFTVTVSLGKLSYTPAIILDLPLQNSFTDVSASALSLVAANANGLPSFVSDGSGGYAVDFGGTKSIKTSTNLPINTSDKVSIAFRIKTSQTGLGLISELSAAYDSNNGFRNMINDVSANKTGLGDYKTGYNFRYSAASVNTGSWVHIVLIIDRPLGINQNTIYINKVNSTTAYSLNTDNNGNYGSHQLFIGQRNGSLYSLIGQLKQFTIWNYPISQQEINDHYNR